MVDQWRGQGHCAIQKSVGDDTSSYSSQQVGERQNYKKEIMESVFQSKVKHGWPGCNDEVRFSFDGRAVCYMINT